MRVAFLSIDYSITSFPLLQGFNVRENSWGWGLELESLYLLMRLSDPIADGIDPLSKLFSMSSTSRSAILSSVGIGPRNLFPDSLKVSSRVLDSIFCFV